MRHGNQVVSKVDLGGMKRYAIESLKFIESWNKEGKEEYTPDTDVIGFKRPSNGHMPSVKRRRYKRCVTHIKSELYTSKTKSEQHKVKLSTYRRYMGKIRNAIYKECNLKHPSLNSRLNMLLSDYPEYTYQLNKIRLASMKDVLDVKRKVINFLEEDGTLSALNLLNQIKPYDKDISEGSARIDPLPVQHYFIEALHPTDSEQKEAKENIESNFRQKKNISITYDQVQGVMNECLESNDFNELAIGIALATGRRAIEVIHTGIFSKGRKSHEIRFKGQAKKSKNVTDKINYIPLMIDSEAVINAVDKLRKTDKYLDLIKEIKDKDLYEQNVIINRRTAPSLNSVIRKWFNFEAGSGFTFHTSRTIAANIAWDKLSGNTSDRRSEFFAIYEGHRRADGKTSHVSVNNYDYVRIDYEGKAPTKEPEATKETNLSALETMWEQLATDEITKKLAVRKLYQRIMDTVKIKAFSLTASSITKGVDHNGEKLRIGGGRVMVMEFLKNETVQKGIQQFHDDNGLIAKKSNRGSAKK
jgi:hypothetical protein